MRIMQEILFSTSLLLLALITFYTTTTSAQLSPIQPPTSSPPAPPLTSPPSPPLPQPSPPSPPASLPPAAAAPAPGLNTVPLVPVTPGAAPTAIIPKAPTTDIIEILRKAKRFSVLIRLMKTTQLINQLNSQLLTSGSGGLTIFAPEDSAFTKLKAGFLNSLSDRQKVELLQFHTLSSFISISNFDTLTNPVQTQAGDDPQRLQFNVTTYGGSQVSIATGAVNATVTGTLYTDTKLAIYQVDKVLLPLDLVLPSKAPAAAPVAAKKGGLTKTNSSSADGISGGGGGGDDDSDSALPADISAGYVSFKVGLIWVNFVVGAGLVGGAMI